MNNRALRPEIAKIIDAGKQVEFAAGSSRPIFGVSLVSLSLLWLSFTPVDFAPMAWVALVPLCLLLRVDRLPKGSYRMITLAGFIWATATLQWMRLGHWTMHGALCALAFYVSLYIPAFVAIGRRLVAAKIPVWLAVPIAWTSLEFLRAYLLTGFSWYYLGHTQYKWTALVQIADLTGAYGVSFLVALVAGTIAAGIPATTLVRLRLAASEDNVATPPKRSVTTAAAVTLGLLVSACVYGGIRTTLPADAGNGPVVAVVQGNFTPEVKHDPDKWLRMVREHDLLTRRAAGLRPDLILWPESMFPVPDQIIGEGVTDDDLLAHLQMDSAVSNSEFAADEIERWHSGYARTLLFNRAQEAGSAMIVGTMTEVAEKSARKRFNSATLVRPDLGYAGRYDKMHRVIFGEYIPLKNMIPWLENLSPYGAGFGLDAGEQPSVFEYNGIRYSPIICFEDTVPQLVRKFVNTTDAEGNSPDVLINLTNDGWFRGSSELDQHLITATFRCIETRRPMVRAVNAGISAFIDSCGRIRQPEHFLVMKEDESGVTGEYEAVESMINPETGQRYRQCSAVMCGQVPLDGRSTVYAQFGDWFAILCSLVTIIGLALGRKRTAPDDGTPSTVTPESKNAA